MCDSRRVKRWIMRETTPCLVQWQVTEIDLLFIEKNIIVSSVRPISLAFRHVRWLSVRLCSLFMSIEIGIWFGEIDGECVWYLCDGGGANLVFERAVWSCPKGKGVGRGAKIGNNHYLAKSQMGIQTPRPPWLRHSFAISCSSRIVDFQIQDLVYRWRVDWRAPERQFIQRLTDLICTFHNFN